MEPAVLRLAADGGPVPPRGVAVAEAVLRAALRLAGALLELRWVQVAGAVLVVLPWRLAAACADALARGGVPPALLVLGALLLLALHRLARRVGELADGGLVAVHLHSRLAVLEAKVDWLAAAAAGAGGGAWRARGAARAGWPAGAGADGDEGEWPAGAAVNGAPEWSAGADEDDEDDGGSGDEGDGSDLDTEPLDPGTQAAGASGRASPAPALLAGTASDGRRRLLLASVAAALARVQQRGLGLGVAQGAAAVGGGGYL
ncbi:hypothetical protein HT031_004536 [Scenedesmus sp. PABB004]|nr:hypothetical protein HT031_004536 [Scenedesmus sp. PABB004]